LAKNSYDIIDRQKPKKLEHALSQQQFDWKHSPANDLRRALQQAQLSLEEISENKFLESSLRDLLKHRIAPTYYMQIYQTPIRQISIQLNELWKHAALPMKHAYSETGKGHYALNFNNVKQISDNNDLKEVRKQPLLDQEKFQQIMQQLQEVSSELQKVKNNVAKNARARKLVDKPNMNCKRDVAQSRCYQCNDLGRIAKFCRSTSQTSNRGKVKPSFKGRRREISLFGTDRFGKYQSAQYAEVDFDKNQPENHRWDDGSKTNTHFNDNIEEINNTRLESSEDENTD